MPTGKDSVQVAVIMPKELKERLQEFAKSKRWSLSQAGLVLIEEALERAETEAKGKGEK
jgi:predicted DNA-binding protein